MGTNDNLAATRASAPAELQPESDTDEEKPPMVDPTLSETEHILLDYVSLLNKGNIVTAIH